MTAPTDDVTSPSRAQTRPMRRGRPATDISRVPYLPGLDGMRAFAVVAVMVYHANSDWLPGGFLGVEVFFVISGYLITLLLIAEKERTFTVNMGQFWLRRAKRLLPALFTMLILLTIWTSLFERDALGKLRGDVVAALAYVSNWYQIWTGAGYTAASDFAPLRHLWSLAVEEQFYLLWPIVMVTLLRGGSRRIADVSRWLVLTAVVITVAMAILYHPGPVGTAQSTPEAFWTMFGREISKLDALYLSTITRASGLLLGAAFAMLWRPVAVMRGPLREKGPLLDLVALAGFVALGAMSWWMYLIDVNGANAWLFRGGFLMCGIATLMVVAAVTHQYSITSRVLANPVLLWLGTRSYGLYLYHWPIYQLIRKIAGKHLTFVEFAVAMVVTCVITEASYRLIETPIRKGTMGASLARSWRAPTVGPRNALAIGGLTLGALSLFAGYSIVTAPLLQNEVRLELDRNEEALCDVLNDPTCGADAGEDPAPPGSDGVVDDGPEPVTSADVVGSVVAPPPSVVETTTPPPVPISKLAIGDSVMKGAAVLLGESGFTVDAEESRQFLSGVEIVQGLKAQGRLGDVVVINLGTNGTIGSSTMEQMMEALADVPQVLLMTIAAPVDWKAGNNSLLYATANQHPNVTLVDWDGLSRNCPGDCFYHDGYHLKPDGQRYYVQLINDFLAL